MAQMGRYDKYDVKLDNDQRDVKNNVAIEIHTRRFNM